MKKQICMMAAVAAMGCHRLPAQTVFGIEYATEMQTDLKALNWVNLLRLSLSQPLCGGIGLEIGSISIAKTRTERMIDDMQGFSNIEEENLPFALSVAGVSFSRGSSRLFAGIRNINEDYFTSPVTSLFTNSSCGLFPTVSANYPIANYPLSSLGIHYALETGGWDIQASLYNGRGYNGFTRGNSPLRFSPRSDGLCGAVSLNYHDDGSSYHIGSVLYGGHRAGTGQAETGSVSGAVWSYAEQRLTQKLYLLMQYSAAFPRGAWCRMFGGMGVTMRFRRAEAGIYSNCALFSGVKEYASELTCRIGLSRHAYLQPAVHLIGGPQGFRAVALMRLDITQ